MALNYTVLSVFVLAVVHASPPPPPPPPCMLLLLMDRRCDCTFIDVVLHEVAVCVCVIMSGE